MFQPVTKTAIADRFGYPIDGLVKINHSIANIGRAYVPGVFRVVDERIAGAPAKGIVVGVLLLFEQQSTFAQQSNDQRVGIFEKLAGDRCHFIFEVAIQADSMHHRQIVSLAER